MRLYNLSNACIATILTYLMATQILFAQKEDFEKISKNEYEVLNDFFDRFNTDVKIQVYHKTYFDKGWAIFFSDPDLRLIKSEVGIPMKVSHEALDSILTKDRLAEIRGRITISIPLRLKQSKVIKNIELVESFDDERNLDVLRVTEPIIVDDIAIFRTISLSEAPIYLMRKENGKWDVIYTFNEWLILE